MKKYVLFILLLIVALLFGLTEEIFILIVVVTIHELSHVLMALVFKLKPQKISQTPIGQIVTIKGLEYIEAHKRVLIHLAGPIANLLLWYISQKFYPDKYNNFKIYNFAIGIFNFLPVVPLDGAKIFQVILGNKIGVLKANKFLLKLSKVICAFIFLFGIIQVILYPFNISLFCIGIYVSVTIPKEKIIMAADFYKMLLVKNKRMKKTTLIAKNIVATEKTSIRNILQKLNSDNFFIINIINDDTSSHIITESEFVNYIFNYGVKGNLKEIINTYKNY